MTLEKLRKELKETDFAILELISKRAKISKKIGIIKKKQGLKIYQPKVEKEKLVQLEKIAKKRKLDTNLIKIIFRTLMKESKKIQLQTKIG